MSNRETVRSRYSPGRNHSPPSKLYDASEQPEIEAQRSRTDSHWSFTAVLFLAVLLIVHAGLTFVLHPLWYSEAADTVASFIRSTVLAHRTAKSRTAPGEELPSPFPLSRALQVFDVRFDENYTPPLIEDTRRRLVDSPINFATNTSFLEESTSGSCFAFDGENGNVVMELETATSSFAGATIDNSNVLPIGDPTCLPREIHLWGLHNGSTAVASIQRHILSFGTGVTVRPGPGGKSYVLLSKGHVNPVSRFGMRIRAPVTVQGVWFEAFLVQVKSNWGEDYTCLPPIRFYEYISSGQGSSS